MAARTLRSRLGVPALVAAGGLALAAFTAAPAAADDHRRHYGGDHRDGRHVERQIGYALKLFLGSRPHYAYPERRYVYRYKYAYRPHVYRPYGYGYGPRYRHFYGSHKHAWKGHRHGRHDSGRHGSRHRGRRHR